MRNLTVFVTEQAVSLDEAGIELDLCFDVLGDDVRQRDVTPVNRLLPIFQVVDDTVYAVSVFGEDFELVILVIP